MPFHPRPKFRLTAGLLAEPSCREIGRMSPTGPLRGFVRAQVRRRDWAIPREPDSFHDPDGEAGRGRLGHAY